MRLLSSALVLLSASMLPTVCHADTYKLFLVDSDSKVASYVYGITADGGAVIHNNLCGQPHLSYPCPLYSTYFSDYAHIDSNTPPPVFTTPGDAYYSGLGSGTLYVGTQAIFSGAVVPPSIKMNAEGDVAFDNSTPLADRYYLAIDETTHMAPTPEPSSLALIGSGVLGAFGVLRRRINR